MSEDLLFTRFINNDEDAYSELYEEYVQDLYAYGMSICGCEEDSMDAIHDVFYKLYFKKEELHSVQHIKAYLLRSLRNRLMDIRKHTERIDHTEISDFIFKADVTVLDTIVDEEERLLLKKKVEALLNTLSSHQKEVIYLRYMQELEYDEIARILNINPESVRKQVYRAIDNLRKQASSEPVIALIICAFLK